MHCFSGFLGQKTPSGAIMAQFATWAQNSAPGILFSIWMNFSNTQAIEKIYIQGLIN